MLRQKTPWLIAGALVLLILAGVVLFGDGGNWLFNHTGEDALSSQVAALPLLAKNILYPNPRTEPFAEIAYADVNPFGINTFLHQEVEIAKREEQLRLISAAGFHWIRQEFPWEDIEIAGRGDYRDCRNDRNGDGEITTGDCIDAWEKYDNIADLADQYDVEIIARLSNPPAWSRAVGDEMGTYAPPDDIADFARYAEAVADHYQGQITYYQIWNEPNIYPEWGEYPVDPEAYTELLCAAYRAIKATNPEAVVLSGALAPTAELSGRDLNDFIFLQRMYDHGAGECFDILSMQGYGLWSGPTDQRMRPLIVNYGRNEFIRDIMVRNGDENKAIWISEMNWNVSPEDVEPRYGRVTLEQQANFAPLAYQRAQEDWPWIGVVAFWYFKRADDSWLQARAPEAYFQMAEPDFTLMPVYDSMATYTAQPPVMYPGSHAPSHWAVEYGAGWIAGESAATAGNGADPARFIFDGHTVEIHLNSSGARYRIDEKRWRNIRGRDVVRWRGARGQHTVEIETDGSARITRYVVKDGFRWGRLVLGVLILAGAGAAYAVMRFRAA